MRNAAGSSAAGAVGPPTVADHRAVVAPKATYPHGPSARSNCVRRSLVANAFWRSRAARALSGVGAARPPAPTISLAWIDRVAVAVWFVHGYDVAFWSRSMVRV